MMNKILITFVVFVCLCCSACGSADNKNINSQNMSITTTTTTTQTKRIAKPNDASEAKKAADNYMNTTMALNLDYIKSFEYYDISADDELDEYYVDYNVECLNGIRDGRVTVYIGYDDKWYCSGMLFIKDCDRCNGIGFINNEECTKCDGKGVINDYIPEDDDQLKKP